MIHGLSAQENEFIFAHLINPLKKAGCQVYLFGSRATKKNKKFSDIDLLYSADSSTDPQIEKTIFKLLTGIEDSKFPYKIDLVKLQDLASSFRDKVDAEKIEV